MYNALSGKHVTLGITGSVAAYKVYELIRELKQYDAKVQVILSPSAKHFVSEMVLQALSGNKVLFDMFSCEDEIAMDHISIARNTDLLVIAPATANFIAKAAQGIADELLLNIILATTKPIAIVPAMNVNMWNNQATQDNVNILRHRKFKIWGPATGVQACGDEGYGRMIEAEQVLANMEYELFADKCLQGKNIVITAGSTIERIDPIRYISNFSSGKMGFALAKAAKLMGANVTLISGKTELSAPANVDCEIVESADEMLKKVKHYAKRADIFIANAAVADYTPHQYVEHKIKKDAANMNIKLVQTEDILSTVTNSNNPPFCVGFAAETQDIAKNAITKLKNKKLQLVVANQIENHFPFGSDENKVSVFNAGGSLYKSDRASKFNISINIMKIIAEQLNLKTF